MRQFARARTIEYVVTILVYPESESELELELKLELKLVELKMELELKTLELELELELKTGIDLFFATATAVNHFQILAITEEVMIFHVTDSSCNR